MDSYFAAEMQPRSVSIKLPGQSGDHFLMQYGNQLLPLLQRASLPFTAKLTAVQGGLMISGDKVAVVIAAEAVKRIAEAKADDVTSRNRLAKLVDAATSEALKREMSLRLRGLPRPLRPMSPSQIAFLQAILQSGNELTFGIGPTGTGKTHIAIAAALNLLDEERVKHVVITRPHIVMDGEVLTPSTRNELEYDDQFEFLEDILLDLVGNTTFRQLIESRRLELMPLGHMRGRTFNDALLVVDEAQNMSVRKMRMVVTRIGRGSRMVLTGDPEHVDLRGDEPSGLAHLLGMVEGTDLAKVFRFVGGQNVRSPLATRLEQLYAQNCDTRPELREVA